MADMLSDEQLAQIEVRCDQSTPGPWKSHVEGEITRAATALS